MFVVGSLTVKTANFTSLENYRIYGIYSRANAVFMRLYGRFLSIECI